MIKTILPALVLSMGVPVAAKTKTVFFEHSAVISLPGGYEERDWQQAGLELNVDSSGDGQAYASSTPNALKVMLSTNNAGVAVAKKRLWLKVIDPTGGASTVLSAQGTVDWSGEVRSSNEGEPSVANLTFEVATYIDHESEDANFKPLGMVSKTSPADSLFPVEFAGEYRLNDFDTRIAAPAGKFFFWEFEINAYCEHICKLDASKSFYLEAIKVPIGAQVDFGDGELVSPDESGHIYTRDWVAAVPEPTSVNLIGGALGVLAARRLLGFRKLQRRSLHASLKLDQPLHH